MEKEEYVVQIDPPPSHPFLSNSYPLQLTSEKSVLRRAWRFAVVCLLFNLEKVTVAVLAFSIFYGHRFPNMIMGAWTVALLR